MQGWVHIPVFAMLWGAHRKVTRTPQEIRQQPKVLNPLLYGAERGGGLCYVRERESYVLCFASEQLSRLGCKPAFKPIFHVQLPANLQCSIFQFKPISKSTIQISKKYLQLELQLQPTCCTFSSSAERFSGVCHDFRISKMSLKEFVKRRFRVQRK